VSCPPSVDEWRGSDDDRHDPEGLRDNGLHDKRIVMVPDDLVPENRRVDDDLAGNRDEGDLQRYSIRESSFIRSLLTPDVRFSLLNTRNL
jgi:hypothetical protein